MLLIMPPTAQSYPAGQSGFFMVRCHFQSLDKELHRFIDAVLIIKTQASNVQRVCICRIHSQDVTVKKRLALKNGTKKWNKK